LNDRNGKCFGNVLILVHYSRGSLGGACGNLNPLADRFERPSTCCFSLLLQLFSSYPSSSCPPLPVLAVSNRSITSAIMSDASLASIHPHLRALATRADRARDQVARLVQLLGSDPLNDPTRMSMFPWYVPLTPALDNMTRKGC
jgi:hypothetical protein